MKKYDKKGCLYVISGPSGVGKGTLLAEILKRHSEIKLSVSATTRNPRPGEIEGVNYFFTDKVHFEQLIEQNKLIEWAEFAENYYGTFVETVENALKNGIDLALEIDVQGALQVKEKIKGAILIFVVPPSFEVLKSRLIGRNTESNEVILKRLSIAESELEKAGEFNYKVINDDLETALSDLETIIISERNKK